MKQIPAKLINKVLKMTAVYQVELIKTIADMAYRSETSCNEIHNMMGPYLEYQVGVCAEMAKTVYDQVDKGNDPLDIEFFVEAIDAEDIMD